MLKSAFQRALLQNYGMVRYDVPLAGEIISVFGVWGMTHNGSPSKNYLSPAKIHKKRM